MPDSSPSKSIALVVNTYNQAHFLRASIQSGLNQTVQFNEVIVVDDGSTDNPAAVVAEFPGVRFIRQSNAGLSASRNTGLEAASSDYIVFLDADDLLTPCAVQSGMTCHENNPGSGLVYGAHRRIAANGEPLGGDIYSDIGTDAFRTLLTGNAIGMHATVIYNRSNLREIGGFDVTLPRCEDYDVYFRMATRYRMASHPDVTALYRWHGDNMSANHSTMLKWVLHINSRQKVHTAGNRSLEAIRLLGRRIWTRYYVEQLEHDMRRRWSRDRRPPNLHQLMMALSLAPRFAMELGRWLVFTLVRI